MQAKNKTKSAKQASHESEKVEKQLCAKLAKQIAHRHKFTSFERLWLRELLVQVRMLKIYKEVKHIVDTTDIRRLKISALKRDILAFERRNFELAELKNSKVAKALLKEGIALNEVFELKSDECAVKAFFRRHNKDTLNAELFDKTLAIAKKLEIKVVFIARKHSGAYYSPSIKTIFMFFNNKPKKTKAIALLHELIHSVSTSDLNHLECTEIGIKTARSKPQIKPLRKIKKICSTLQNATKAKFYGLTNIYEFMAELSNPEFRAFLQKNGFLKMALNGYYKFLENMAK